MMLWGSQLACMSVAYWVGSQGVELQAWDCWRAEPWDHLLVESWDHLLAVLWHL